jgi:putative PIN family toxin of toxin-antitoxin system
MIRVVLDTNVVVSAHLNPQGREALILELAVAGRLRCFASAELLKEYDEVLHRPKFGFSSKAAAVWLRELRSLIRPVRPRQPFAGYDGHR